MTEFGKFRYRKSYQKINSAVNFEIDIELDAPSKPLSSIVSNREVGPEVNHSGSSSTLLSLLRRGFQFLFVLARSYIPF